VCVCEFYAQVKVVAAGGKEGSLMQHSSFAPFYLSTLSTPMYTFL